MTDEKQLRWTAIGVIGGVLIAVIYDILQGFFISIYSQPSANYSIILLDVGAKLLACVIALGVGVFWLKQFTNKKNNEKNPES